MEERFPGADQWNSLHERLVDAWKKQAALLPPGSPLYFAPHSSADELGEDVMTVAYLKETAEQAGLDTDWISMEEIGWDRLSGRFVDNKLRFIRGIFKLYPWESAHDRPLRRARPRHPRQRRWHRLRPVDRTRLEDAARRQGPAGDPLGALPGPPPTSSPPTSTARATWPAPPATSPSPCSAARALA
ncbi:hypothetical protein SGRIM128S_09790 [Streptomyces griseomycini]